MRKFGVIPSACVVFLFTALAHGQQTDFGFGASTLFSSKNTNASQLFTPPAEKAGLYASFAFTRVYSNHFGFNAEIATLRKRGVYDGLQEFRPILYDFNGVYARQIAKKTRGDLMAGIGGQRVIFYDQVGFCTSPTGCPAHFNGNQFLLHAAADIRYTVWRHIFVRPEVHYYRILNNTDFHSDNVFRLGASVGYTFGQ